MIFKTSGRLLAMSPVGSTPTRLRHFWWFMEDSAAARRGLAACSEFNLSYLPSTIHPQFALELGKSRVRAKRTERASRVRIDPDHHSGAKFKAFIQPRERLVWFALAGAAQIGTFVALSVGSRT